MEMYDSAKPVPMTVSTVLPPVGQLMAALLDWLQPITWVTVGGVGYE